VKIVEVKNLISDATDEFSGQPLDILFKTLEPISTFSIENTG